MLQNYYVKQKSTGIEITYFIFCRIRISVVKTEVFIVWNIPFV
jgi:hypothetical protein